MRPIQMTEKLEPLHHLAEEILGDDAKGKFPLKYTKDDIVAATVVFSHVMGAQFTHVMIDEKVPLGVSRHLAQHLGTEVQHLVKYATKVDIKIREIT